MLRFKVRLIIRKMGKTCQSCEQSFELELSATSCAEAITKAKKLSNNNLDTQEINIELNEEI
ncbi:hypothetical protein vBSsoS008_023 [Shigella phage vB_SsoS_008]|nr:hypothetical protein vBSsoS008_023 [Shigella phage vB_SsoS_008]